MSDNTPRENKRFKSNDSQDDTYFYKPILNSAYYAYMLKYVSNYLTVPKPSPGCYKSKNKESSYVMKV